MGKRKYSSPNDDKNNGSGSFSCFPTFNLSSMLCSSGNNLLSPNSQVGVAGIYNDEANGSTIAHPARGATLVNNANKGNVPILPRIFCHGESSGSSASPVSVVRGIPIEPDLGRLICLPSKHSVAWKDEKGKLIAIVTKHPNPRATYNVQPLHSFEVEVFSNAMRSYGFASYLGPAGESKPAVEIKELDGFVNDADVKASAAENVIGIAESSSNRKFHSGLGMGKDFWVRKTVIRIETKNNITPSDGYSWRKYGQKNLKGNPHGPRCYYKCNIVGCSIRKQVERAVDDPKYLVATYVGKHTHLVPNPRGKTKITYARVPMPPLSSPIAIQQATPSAALELQNVVASAHDVALPYVVASTVAVAANFPEPLVDGSVIGQVPLPPPPPLPRPFCFDLNIPPPPEEDEDDVMAKANEPTVV